MIRIMLEFMPESTITIEGFTSIVSKTILKGIQDYEIEISNFINNSLSNFTISPVMINNKPVYKFRDSGKKIPPVLLYGGKTYTFYVSFLSEDAGYELQELLNKHISTGWRLPLYNSNIFLTASRINSIDLNELSVELTGDFRIDFMTPTQFTIKPPIPTTKSWLRLFPLSHTLIASIASHWNKHVPDEMKIDTKNISKIAYSYIHEAGYYLRPVTVTILKENNHKRIIRGFVGWCVYKVDEKLSPEEQKIISKLLAYAEFIGVGNGKEIGLGMIKVKPGKITHENSSEIHEELIKNIG